MSETIEAEVKPDALATTTPMKLIELAVQQGANADQLGKLMDLQLRWQAHEAKQAYVAAIHKFKENPPDINKSKKVSYPNKDGSETVYFHPELDDITIIIGSALKKVGITHSWRTGSKDGRISVTCVLTHEQGHSEDVAGLDGPADTSGGKNNIQAIGSTTSYLQRYTLLSGTGLAAKGQDDDGATDGLGSDAVRDYITKIEDASDITELQKNFTEAYKSAKSINDRPSMDLFIRAKDEKKRVLR